ncbi:MAG TPA: DUF5658 family protein [Phycisphaerales bacterium]|nr:DUF5658 family protein [Phycisphaerales bacterium]
MKRPFRKARYPEQYVWYLFAASLDIMLTFAIIEHFGGSEVNAVADALLRRFGLWGLIGLKYSTVVVVIAICELIGAKYDSVGKKLALVAIAVSALPVGVGLIQLSLWLGLANPPPAVTPGMVHDAIREAELQFR